jgi:hypothetical protein
MTGDDGVQLLWFVMAFTLAISAIVAHRIPLGTTLKMVLAWAGIFGLAFLLAWGWQLVR